MFPGATACDAFYSRDAHLKLLGYIQIPFAIRDSTSDFQNITISQLGHAVLLASTVCAMLYSVVLVFPWRSIFEIADMVVCWVSIKMPALHPFWAWADECRKHQGMDIAAETAVVTAKHYAKPAGIFSRGLELSCFAPWSVGGAGVSANR